MQGSGVDYSDEKVKTRRSQNLGCRTYCGAGNNVGEQCSWDRQDFVGVELI